ncbi:MAG: SLC13 family permease [Sarcina sp.]
MRNEKMLKAIKFAKANYILVAAIILAIISSIFLRPKLSYINYRLLIILFVLMLIFSGFNRIKFLDYISVSLVSRCKTSRILEVTLVFLTFFMAMIVTNDVAVIIMVPITILIGKKVKFDVLKVVILQDIGANLGSFFTPMGNPRNLFLYSHYKLNAFSFMKVTAPYLVVSIIFIMTIIMLQKSEVIGVNLERVKVESKKEGIILFIVLIYDLLCVFNVVSDVSALVITVIVVLFIDKKAFKGVNYKLLITFVGFFIFVGNISNIPEVRIFMENILVGKYSTFFITLFAEQIISGVPTVMMLSNFTVHYKELILAINIGSMGTLISTMANLISYKSFTESFGESGKYFKMFTIYNLVGN